MSKKTKNSKIFASPKDLLSQIIDKTSPVKLRTNTISTNKSTAESYQNNFKKVSSFISKNSNNKNTSSTTKNLPITQKSTHFTQKQILPPIHQIPNTSHVMRKSLDPQILKRNSLKKIMISFLSL